MASLSRRVARGANADKVFEPFSRGPARRCTSVSASRDESVRQLEEFSSGVGLGLKNAQERWKRYPISQRFVVSAQAEATLLEVATTPATKPAGLRELNTDDFYQFLEEAGDTLVVVDFFTDWCGPCKLIYPQLVQMSEELSSVKFTKFNCNKRNKDLGVKLGIKVAPTFHLYKNSQKVAEVTGAKVDRLRELVLQHQ